jgi:hypothetical protein
MLVPQLVDWPVLAHLRTMYHVSGHDESSKSTTRHVRVQ